MATTRDEIGHWFDRGVKEGADYMIIWVDTFDYEDYPEFVHGGAEAARTALSRPANMTRAMECYDLKADKNSQLNKYRCWAVT